MNIRKFLLLASLLSLFFVTASCAQSTPKVSLSATRIPAKGWVNVHGSGFTPRKNVSSHLLKPDGMEFPVLPILTDDHGEFSHDIDTLLLEVGTHTLWVVDENAKTTSNSVKFDVTLDQR